MLTPPPAPRRTTPPTSPAVLASDPASGVPATDRLQFTVVDVPSAEAPSSSVIRLPPLPEPLPSAGATVHRLPPAPEQAVMPASASPGAAQSQKVRAPAPTAYPPAASAPVASSAASVPAAQGGADRPQLPNEGPIIEAGRVRCRERRGTSARPRWPQRPGAPRPPKPHRTTIRSRPRRRRPEAVGRIARRRGRSARRDGARDRQPRCRDAGVLPRLAVESPAAHGPQSNLRRRGASRGRRSQQVRASTATFGVVGRARLTSDWFRG